MSGHTTYRGKLLADQAISDDLRDLPRALTVGIVGVIDRDKESMGAPLTT